MRVAALRRPTGLAEQSQSPGKVSARPSTK
jgi:hypothetical protein